MEHGWLNHSTFDPREVPTPQSYPVVIWGSCRSQWALQGSGAATSPTSWELSQPTELGALGACLGYHEETRWTDNIHYNRIKLHISHIEPWQSYRNYLLTVQHRHTQNMEMSQMISCIFLGRTRLPIDEVFRKLRPGFRFWLFTYFDSRLVFVAQNDTRRSSLMLMLVGAPAGKTHDILIVWGKSFIFIYFQPHPQIILFQLPKNPICFSTSSAIIKWCTWLDSGWPLLEGSWAEEVQLYINNGLY